MNKTRVYDVPTRLFHWIFAVLFLFAFIVAKNVDDDSALFSYHMFAGLTLGFVVLLRLIWGIWGSSHARFTGFALHPRHLVQYAKGFFTGHKQKWAGHNPASSWAGLIMMILALGLSITGYLMTSTPNKEDFEDFHEIFANAFMIVVLLHVAGLIIHTLRHRDFIASSMVDGKKSDVRPQEGIPSSHRGIGLVFLLLVSLYGIYLYKNYDSQQGTLNFMGTTLEIGEPQKADMK